MQEQRQNWHRFRRIFGFLPSKRRGMAVLTGDRKILSGAVSAGGKGPFVPFQEEGMMFEHIESAHEFLAQKYNVSGVSFIDRSELMQALAQLTASKTGESYYTQLSRLREMLKIQSGEKTKLAAHLGDKPVQDFWPRENFLLSIFHAVFADLLPERKILLFGLVKSERERQFLALEFSGEKLRVFHHPDISHLEWCQGPCDFFHRDLASRLVLWCENHYMLPTYAFIFHEHAWRECCEQQEQHGERAAWKHFWKIKQAKDTERELRVEPEPWPLKACLRWYGVK